MPSKLFAALIAAIGLGFGVAAADVYTWVDDEGEVHYSDKPDYIPAERLNVRTQPANPARMAAQAEDQETLDQARLIREHQEIEDNQAAEADRQFVLAERESNCQKARERMEVYTEAHRLYRPTAEGGREYLSADEIDRARADTMKDVNEWCD